MSTTEDEIAAARGLRYVSQQRRSRSTIKSSEMNPFRPYYYTFIFHFVSSAACLFLIFLIRETGQDTETGGWILNETKCDWTDEGRGMFLNEMFIRPVFVIHGFMNACK